VALEFLCDCCTAESREVEVLGRFEVLQGLLEVCGVSGAVAGGGEVATEWVKR